MMPVMRLWQSGCSRSTPKYAVFRVSADAVSTSIWNIERFSDSMGNGGGSLPALTIELIPEPATITLLGLARIFHELREISAAKQP